GKPAFNFNQCPAHGRSTRHHGGPGGIAAGLDEPDAECHRSDEGNEHSRQTYDHDAAGRESSTPRVGDGYRGRPTARTRGANLHCVLYFTTPRHRYGIAD